MCFWVWQSTSLYKRSRSRSGSWSRPRPGSFHRPRSSGISGRRSCARTSSWDCARFVSWRSRFLLFFCNRFVCVRNHTYAVKAQWHRGSPDKRTGAYFALNVVIDGTKNSREMHWFSRVCTGCEREFTTPRQVRFFSGTHYRLPPLICSWRIRKWTRRCTRSSTSKARRAERDGVIRWMAPIAAESTPSAPPVLRTKRTMTVSDYWYELDLKKNVSALFCLKCYEKTWVCWVFGEWLSLFASLGWTWKNCCLGERLRNKKNSLVYPLVTFIDGFVPPWPVGNAPTIEELFSTFLTSARYDYVWVHFSYRALPDISY